MQPNVMPAFYPPKLTPSMRTYASPERKYILTPYILKNF